jgi:DNA helicase-2/ATP-dependent DNA helicase PcrA
MPKQKFYVVAKGRKTGFFDNWASCLEQVKGFSGADYKSFTTMEEAEEWYVAKGGILPKKKAVVESTKAIYTDKTDIVSKIKEKTENDCNKKENIIESLHAKILKDRENIPPIEDSLEEFCHSYGYSSNERDLSDDQKRAIQKVNGKSLLFAVPGSGKTTVIIARTGYLLHGKHGLSISPDELMTLTFTKAAAAEMRNRYIAKFPEDEHNKPDFRTIHSFCMSKVIEKLRIAGCNIPENVINMEKEDIYIDDDENQQKVLTMSQYEILRAAMKKANVPGYSDDTVRESIVATITSIKNRMLLPKDYEDKVLVFDKKEYSVAKIYDAYEEQLRLRDCMDYDDMLKYSLDGLKQYPHVLKQLQEVYHYWSIDETQDNSALQSELMNLLVGEKGNLFVVGDDDQSIYNFRGAEPRLLLEYGNNSNVETMIMGINYRSDKNIVDTNKEFIEMNYSRADKQMEANEKSCGNINFYTLLNDVNEQYEHIIASARKEICANNTLAVIYRLNASALPVAMWLKKAGIEFNISKDFNELIYSRIFRDFISLFRFAVNQKSYKNFLPCQYNLHIYLQKETREKLEKYLEDDAPANILDIMSTSQENLNEYTNKAKQVLQEILHRNPFEAVKYILSINPSIVKSESATDRLRLYSIFSACLPYATISDFVTAINELIEASETVAAEGHKSKINLTSMHSAKGLEFDHVIIIDSWEEIINADRQQVPNQFIYEDDEEERRLFYVAMTRAKHTLDLLVPQSYYGNVEMPCSYITEYAQICEVYSKQVIQQKKLEKKTKLAQKEIIYNFTNQKYYAVKVGRKPGVYTTWTECLEQIYKFSGAQYKSCSSKEEAISYSGIETNRQKLHKEEINKRFLSTPVITFNSESDMPAIVNEAIFNWFGVDSLLNLSHEKIISLKEQRRKINFNIKQQIDYSESIPYYVAVYLPVNFYKIWLPLRECLHDNILPCKANILELGPGPGTATMSMITFYSTLAKCNPKIEFILDYTVVEREQEFLKVFSALVNHVIKNTKIPNLIINLRQINADAFSFLAQEQTDNYDVIIESNMLNHSEAISNDKLSIYATALKGLLNEDGLGICIEPGTNEACCILNKLTLVKDCKSPLKCITLPRKQSVNIAEITLNKEAINLGLRSNHQEHWFSYAVFQKEASN